MSFAKYHEEKWECEPLNLYVTVHRIVALAGGSA